MEKNVIHFRWREKKSFAINFSSLHWPILLLFLFVFVQWTVLVDVQLSAGDAIVSQTVSNGEWKKHFHGRDFFDGF